MRTMVKEEEDVSDAESFDSLSSRAKFMSDLLTDSDSSSLSDRNSIYSYGPQTPGTPSPEYMDDGFAVEIMGEKSPRSSRSVSMEASPTFAAKVKEMTTVGPRGPHLFRSFSTNHSTSKVAKITIPQSPRVERVGSRSPPATASRASFSPSLKSRASHGRGPQTADFVKMTPTMDSEPIVLMRPRSEQHSIVSEYDFEEVRSWAPNQVCAWMAALGFENEMVEKFATNDITGAILIDLKWDDLKEVGLCYSSDIGRADCAIA